MNSQATSAVGRAATMPPILTVHRRRPSVLGVVCLASLVVFAYFAFSFAPEDALQGSTQRIFYIHVPSAWISFVGFAVVFGSSIAYLTKRSAKADRLAEASATIGLLFTTVVLVTGMMWGRAIWGVYWTWDPRLTSYLVLWLLYLAYIALPVGLVVAHAAPACLRTRRWWNAGADARRDVRRSDHFHARIRLPRSAPTAGRSAHRPG
jgi:ABC-type transport system involved in cytochrome c biogenesis permease subunit